MPIAVGDSHRIDLLFQCFAYHIKKEANSPEGFHEGKRISKVAKKVTEDELASSVPSHTLRRLQAEVSYLRQEIEFLKKIMQTANGTK
jgi:type IV secretory pathway protease TraF